MCQTKQNVRILWLITQIRNILKRKYHIIISYRPIREIVNLDVLYFAFNNKNNKIMTQILFCVYESIFW